MDSSENVFRGTEAVQKINVKFYKKLYTSGKFQQSITTK